MGPPEMADWWFFNPRKSETQSCETEAQARGSLGYEGKPGEEVSYQVSGSLGPAGLLLSSHGHASSPAGGAFHGLATGAYDSSEAAPPLPN